MMAANCLHSRDPDRDPALREHRGYHPGTNAATNLREKETKAIANAIQKRAELPRREAKPKRMLRMPEGAP